MTVSIVSKILELKKQLRTILMGPCKYFDNAFINVAKWSNKSSSREKQREITEMNLQTNEEKYPEVI